VCSDALDENEAGARATESPMVVKSHLFFTTQYQHNNNTIVFLHYLFTSSNILLLTAGRGAQNSNTKETIL
jgi:hypothetical protein